MMCYCWMFWKVFCVGRFDHGGRGVMCGVRAVQLEEGRGEGGDKILREGLRIAGR